MSQSYKAILKGDGSQGMTTKVEKQPWQAKEEPHLSSLEGSRKAVLTS